MWKSVVCLLALTVAFVHGSREFFDYDFDHAKEDVIKEFLDPRTICPPFDDHVHSVQILGKGNKLNGCAYKYNKVAKNKFELWVASPQHDGELCGNTGTNMDHYSFECAARWRAEPYEYTKGWHFIAFYETEGAKYNRPTYRCTVAETRDNKTISLFITNDSACDSLINYLTKPKTRFAIQQKNDGEWNGVLVINFTPNGSQAFNNDANNKPVEKKPETTEKDQKRVARQTPEGCRFPDWAQGKWMNLRVEDGSAYYPYVIRENDDSDDDNYSYEITGDDGQDGDAESIEHFLERTKRNVPTQVSNNEQIHESDRPVETSTHPTEHTSTSLSPTFLSKQEETKSPNKYHYVTTEIPTTTTYKFPICACTRRGRRSIVLDAGSQKSKHSDISSHKSYYNNGPIQTITKDPLAKFDEYWNLFPTTTTTEGVPTTMNHVTLWPKFFLRRGRRSVPLDKVEEYWMQYPITTTTTKYNIPDTTNKLNTKFCNCNRRSKRSIHFSQNKDNLKSVGRQLEVSDRNLQEPSNTPLSETSQPNNPVTNVKHIKTKRAAGVGLNPFTLFLVNEMNSEKSGRKYSLWDTIKSIFVPSEKNLAVNSSPSPPVTTPAYTTPEISHKNISTEVFKEFLENLPPKSMDIIKNIQQEIDPVNVGRLQEKIKTFAKTYDYFDEHNFGGFIKIRRSLRSKDNTVTLPPRSPPGVPEFMLVRPNQTLDVIDKLEHKNIPLDTDKVQIKNPIKRIKRDIASSINTEIPLHGTTTSSKSSDNDELQQNIKDDVIFDVLLNYFYHMLTTQSERPMNMNQSFKKELKTQNKRSVDENKEETTTMLAGENIGNKRSKRCFWSTTTMIPPPQFPSGVPDLMQIRPTETLDVKDKYEQEHDPLNADHIQTRMDNVRRRQNYRIKLFKRNIPPSVHTKIPLPPSTTQSKEENLSDLSVELIERSFFINLLEELYNMFIPDNPPSITTTTENNQKEFGKRNKRSVDDYDIETTTVDELEDEEKVLEKTRIAEQKKIESFTKWWNEFQPRAVVEYENRKHWREQLNNKDYDNYPERIPSPSPTEYLKSCKTNGIPYKDALIQWRQKERLHRMWRAEVEYTAYPGKNRPEVVMEDFDLTFKDIIYDFDPEHPEGTADDPTAYLVQTLPNGSRIPARLSRYDVWMEKQARAYPSSVEKAQEQLMENEVLRSIALHNTPINRKRRSPDQLTTSKVAWRCMMPVDADINVPQTLPKNGFKYLTVGGRVIENKMGLDENQNSEENNSEKFVGMKNAITYGCLWIVPRGPNVLEFSILGTGTPSVGQDLATFGKQLCAENQTMGRDSETRVRKKLRPRRQSWVTETRSDENNRVPVACPVPTGTVFYGVVPAPPPQPQAVPSVPGLPVAAGFRSAPSQLCAKLVSSTDVCTDGRPGPFDQMKYTVSECVDQNPTTVGKLTKSQVFEATREHHVANHGRNRRGNKRDSSDAQMTVSGDAPSTAASTSSTAASASSTAASASSTAASASSTAASASSTAASFVTDPTDTASTSTAFTATASVGTTTASGVTAPSTFSITSQRRPQATPSGQHYPAPTVANDYYYRQQQHQRQQQWQQQQQQQQQQEYRPPPAGSTSVEYDNNYRLRQWRQQWQQSDYNSRQQQRDYARPYYNDDSHQTPVRPNGSWNVHADRPSYVNGGDNHRGVPLPWDSTGGSAAGGDNGGWSTAAQQHWWHQQQLEQQRQRQRNNRGGGILSLPPVPLPPLRSDQTVVTVPPTLPPRRPPTRPPNHYYQPTPSTRTIPYRLRPKSESRYYEEREYQCLGQWSEVQPQTSPLTGDKPVTFTYTYVKRVDPIGTSGAEYECFVGTTIPNDAGHSLDTTTTLLLTEAGTGTRCSRLADPYQSGMKLVGTKTAIEGSCAGPAQTNSSEGSWYPLKPQQVPSSNGGKWIAAGPVPVPNQGGQLPAGKGGQSQGQQTRRPPTEANGGVRDFGRGTPLKIATLAIALAIVAERLFA